MRSTTIAELAWYALQSHHIEPVPENCRLWFDHHAGANPPLSERINHLISIGAHFDPACMAELRLEFEPGGPDPALMRESSFRLQAFASDMRADAAASGSVMDRLGSALDQYATNPDQPALAAIRVAAA